jgi:RNA polymerase sigma-70 factor (ECF subfamily)
MVGKVFEPEACSYVHARPGKSVRAVAEVDPGAHEATGASPPSFDQCYTTHRDRIYRLCLRYGGGRQGFAEDVTQEVFIRLFENFDRIDRGEPIEAWLYAVASRLCISRLRRDRSFRGWLQRVLHGHRETSPSVAQLFERNEAVSAVMAAIDRLPPRQRVVLCMVAFDGKRQREIARVLRYSEGYVSRLLSQARGALAAAGWQNVGREEGE